jgi:hypothetical protein
MGTTEDCIKELAGIARRTASPKLRRWLVDKVLARYQEDVLDRIVVMGRRGEVTLAVHRGGLKDALHRLLAATGRPSRRRELLEYAFSRLQAQTPR